jgi:hypothetical protein
MPSNALIRTKLDHWLKRLLPTEFELLMLEADRLLDRRLRRTPNVART